MNKTLNIFCENMSEMSNKKLNKEIPKIITNSKDKKSSEKNPETKSNLSSMDLKAAFNFDFK